MTNYCRNKQVKHPKNIQKTLKSFGCNFFPVGYYFYLKLNWFSGKMCALRSIFLKSLCWHKNHKFLVIKANVKNHYCRKWKKRYVVKFFGFIHKKFWDTIFWYFQCIGVERIHLNGEREYRRGGYRAKSSPLPLASLCVSSPTHTSQHWISEVSIWPLLVFYTLLGFLHPGQFFNFVWSSPGWSKGISVWWKASSSLLGT